MDHFLSSLERNALSMLQLEAMLTAIVGLPALVDHWPIRFTRGKGEEMIGRGAQKPCEYRFGITTLGPDKRGLINFI